MSATSVERSLAELALGSTGRASCSPYAAAPSQPFPTLRSNPSPSPESPTTPGRSSRAGLCGRAGLRVDGHDFIPEAIRRGAAVLIVERAFAAQATAPDPPADAALHLVVRRSDVALASAAAWWFGDPSRELDVVGVTGTNGKTTTTFLAAAALEAIGWPTGIVGTIGIRVAGTLRRNDRPSTTPGAIDLQGILREMVDADRRAVVIETSSHGLAAERVASVAYGAAIFTNLSHEHLDFHGTFEAYRAAKLSLFERLPREGRDGRPGIGVVNIDDANGEPSRRRRRPREHGRSRTAWILAPTSGSCPSRATPRRVASVSTRAVTM